MSNGHPTSRHLPCDNVHSEGMSITTKSSHLRINVNSLLSRFTTFTLRPTYTRQLLQFHRPYHTPSINPPRGTATKSLATNKPFDEESLSDYEPEQFYPVNIGDTINSRYRVIGKLGFGANSTVWVCRDLSYEPYTLLISPVLPAQPSLGTISMLC